MEATVLEKLERLGGERRIHYALDRIQAALTDAGSPHKNVQTIVIGGTNGKGTTTLLTSSTLVEHGMRVATFLSPHLQSITERFLLNLAPVDEGAFADVFNTYYPIAEKFQLSFFEFLTFLFFVWAREEKADILVLEVGLGGRLDATNVTTPTACAVTSIDFDHMGFLGHTLELILKEKLGIVPPNGVVVSGVQQPELRTQTAQWARASGIVLYESVEIPTKMAGCDWESQEFWLEGNKFRLHNPNPKMVDNARTAYLLLRKAFPEISIETIARAFEKTRFPGRFETVAQNPRIILSGDHNPAGLDSLFATLDRLPDTELHILCGFSPDKAYLEMYPRLKERAKRIAYCPIENARGKYPPSYFEMDTPFENSGKALEFLWKDCAKNATLLVTGSLYLVGEVGSRFRDRVQFFEH